MRFIGKSCIEPLLRSLENPANLSVRGSIFPHNERRHLNQPPIGYHVPINPF